ncbi:MULTISPECIES: hypothetical protein [Thalassospira]|uniref:Uncharacterized protein n=2 Tax=Thalassospira TaxID=168934 RepID=A0A367WH80_9PROT|nr:MULTISPECIES: hypothetical protein [Thalassospira]MDG4718969.1 hypothetical protein [Thalassospira sp. FZY0004]RCK39931.1 hypothetical protein TH19_02510 [Thalassospira profundimaris]
MFGLVTACVGMLGANSSFAQDGDIRGVRVAYPSAPVLVCDSNSASRKCEILEGEKFPDQIIFYSHDSKNFGAYQIRFLDAEKIHWIPDDMIVIEGQEIARNPVVCGGAVGTLGGKGTRGAGADCVSPKGK